MTRSQEKAKADNLQKESPESSQDRDEPEADSKPQDQDEIQPSEIEAGQPLPQGNDKSNESAGVPNTKFERLTPCFFTTPSLDPIQEPNIGTST